MYAAVPNVAGALVFAAAAATVGIPCITFIRDNKMPPGLYEIALEGSDMTRLVIPAKGGSQTSLVPALTFLADTCATYPRLVFDKDGDMHCLPEFHAPDKDGFSLAGAPHAVLCRNLVPVQRICRQPS